MHSNLEKLKIKKLTSEHSYYQDEIMYKKELIKDAEIKFIKALKQYLHNKPNLQKLVDNFMNKTKHDNSLNNVKDGISEKTPASDFEKKVFREISKVAHPDKTNNEDEELTALYIEASTAYSSHDIITLYKMAIQLNLDIQLDETVTQQIESQIYDMKQESDFVEKNLAYQWILAITPKEKETVLKYYLDNIINKTSKNDVNI